MKLVDQFDRDGDKRLNDEERVAAREHIANVRPAGGRMGPPRGGGPGGRGPGADLGPAAPGLRLAPADVKTFTSQPVYDVTTLRTFFLEFTNPDWENELEAFSHTDVEVPATLVVDGRRFRDVGVHFRGASSLMSVPDGRKRSLNLSLDFVHEEQALGGYRTFNLLNSHMDPTFLRSVLYLQAARAYLPAPQANYARVVINGESWGLYVSAQQFNKDFVRDFYKTTDGARWKVPGSPNGRGGLEYLGDDPAAYKRIYEIKSKDDPASWRALVTLTKVLNETPPDRLEAALAPILDVDEVLKFLALEVTLVNGDGYWTRASDYSLYRDAAGRFHVLPHDANETFGPGGGGGMRGPVGPGGPSGAGGPGGQRGPGEMRGPGDSRGPMGPGGPGGRGGPGGPAGGAELDPLVGLDDATKPLRSKLLAVPALKERYLQYVREIATTWLDWANLEPLVRQYHALIAEDVRADTKRLDTIEAFDAGVGRIKTFVDRRRAFLLGRGQ
jgi:spore coat protein CotH